MLVSVHQQCWPNVKAILNFVSARTAAINLFQADLDKPWDQLWYFYVKALRPRCPFLKRQGRTVTNQVAGDGNI